MTSVNTQQTNFTAGELSPLVYGRSDLQAYYNGARRISNFYVSTAGGVVFRNGTQFVQQSANNNKPFLYKFQFSDVQAYMLEFTDGNIRIFRNRGVVTSGGSPVDVVSPYKEEDLFELKFAQDARELYIVHPRYHPRKLTRTSNTSWTLTKHSPTGISPDFIVQSITGITQANPAVVTYTGDDNYEDGDTVYIEDVVGMTEVNGNFYEIANVNTAANTFELVDVDSTGYTAYSSGGEASNIKNFPAAVTFYEQRLIYGGSSDNPETLWFSKSADFDDFTVGTGATDGLQYTVVSNGDGTNKIVWLRGTQDFLVIGGFDDLLKATGGEGQTAISPDSISIKPTNTYGSASINPISKDQFVAFMQRNGLTFRTFENIALEGIYRPIDRTLISDKITTSGITQIAYQDGAPNIIYCVRNDGNIAALTFDRDQEVVAWYRYETQGNFVSVTTTSRDNQYDDVWVAVERDGNYYIEYMNDRSYSPVFEDFVTTEQNEESDYNTYVRALYESQKNYIHLDSALTFDGSEATDGITLTAAALTGVDVAFTASGAVFSASDVGKDIVVKSLDGSEYGVGVIVTYISADMVKVDIKVGFSSLSINDWYLTTNSVSGLSHLEGQTVGVVVDGALHEDRVVSGGSITLDGQHSVVHIGLRYTGVVETMDLEGGGTTGTAQTKKKSVYKVGFRLYQTLGLESGTDYYKLIDRLMRSALDYMDNPPPLFTGDEVIHITGQKTGKSDKPWSRSQRVIFRQSLPLPAEVQMVVPYFNVSNA